MTDAQDAQDAQDANAHAQAETDRKNTLFAWGREVLQMIGLAARISQATLHELRGITFNAEDAEIAIAIRDALYPPGGGERADHFAHLREGHLKQILKNRFDELKQNRETELQTGRRASAPVEDEEQPEGNVGNFVSTVLVKYISLEVHQFVAVTLWILHTHVYEYFMISPRLIVTSPIRGCGKTTLLDIAEQLTARGQRYDSITAAAIARKVQIERATLLCDEADNMDTAANAMLWAVLNSGYRRGGKRGQVNSKGQAQDFGLYGPLALATIGLSLPLPLMHRAVIIEMARTIQELARYDSADVMTQIELGSVYREIYRWAQTVELSRDPPLPKALPPGRPKDNWRVLIAIADSISEEWGKMAREAAVALSKDRPDEDPGITLLRDIRDTFERLGVDRITSKDLVEELVALEDSSWDSYRGPHDNQQPRKLTQGTLAGSLKPFKIGKTKTVWPKGSRTERGKSGKGYFKEWFRKAWAAYLDTPAHEDESKPNPKHLSPKKPNK
jgi:hypothetical protein